MARLRRLLLCLRLLLLALLAVRLALLRRRGIAAHGHVRLGNDALFLLDEASHGSSTTRTAATSDSGTTLSSSSTKPAMAPRRHEPRPRPTRERRSLPPRRSQPWLLDDTNRGR